MPNTFGAPDPALTARIRELAQSSSCVSFRQHALERMEEREIDHSEVMTCLRKGTAHALVEEKGELRTTVVHRGVGVRVVVAPKGGTGEAICDFNRLAVVTAMESA